MDKEGEKRMKRCPFCNRIAKNFVGQVCEECHDEFDCEEMEHFKLLERNRKKKGELKR